MSIKENIRFFRKKLGYTQDEAAKLAGMSRTYFADVERGRYNPSVQVLKKVASALGVSLEELLNEDDNEKEINKNDDKNNFVDSLIDQLIDDGIISNTSNLDKCTEEIILNAIKMQIALKLKKRTN